jgi:hypothetical protein
MFLYGEENIVDMNKHEFVDGHCIFCNLTRLVNTEKKQKTKNLRYVLGTLDRILTIGYLEDTSYLKKEASMSYQIIVDILNGYQEEK